ncbi:MAG: Clp protease N-terminal domain-containing protein, partial [Actinopolymorphaceae bacterium]
MIPLDLPAALAVAAHVLGCTSETIVDLADVEAIQTTLADAGEPDDAGVVPVAAILLVGFVRRRPYPRRNRRIALATTLQFLALNGWDLDLDDVAGVNRMLDSIAAGPSSEDVARPRLARVGNQLRARLRPLRTGRPRSGAESTLSPAELGGRDPQVHVVRTTEGRRGGMFERFTDRARRATVLAQEEARLLNHNYIGTEHILLGLLHEGEGVAAKALESLGITAEAVRARVEETVGLGEHPPGGHIPFTPRAKKVLELALRESIMLGNNYIGTEHVLLGLIREGAGLAAQVLVKLGVSLDTARAKVHELLGAHGDSGVPGASGVSGVTCVSGGTGTGWEDDVAAMVRDSLLGEELPGGRRSLILREVSAMLNDNDRLQTERDRLA